MNTALVSNFLTGSSSGMSEGEVVEWVHGIVSSEAACSKERNTGIPCGCKKILAVSETRKILNCEEHEILESTRLEDREFFFTEMRSGRMTYKNLRPILAKVRNTPGRGGVEALIGKDDVL